MNREIHTEKRLPNQHHRAEINRINCRRGQQGNVRWITSSGEIGDGLTPHPPGVIFDHAGLALSGGGIRSAAFCLGAIQALEANDKLKAIDYLSTVSGGGYIGCSVTALMGATGTFPFAAKADVGASNQSGINDLQDSMAVQHIRDYSNYLMPRGFDDLSLSVGVVLRGLVVSASVVIGPLLLLAALATWLHPTQNDLQTHDAFGIPIGQMRNGHFFVAIAFTFTIILLLFVWGLGRSINEASGGAPYEFTSNWPRAARIVLGGIFFALFIEAQPFAILSLFGGSSTGNLVPSITRIIQYLAPVAGVITLFAGRLAEIIKARSADPTRKGQLAKISSRALLVFAAIVVPFLLWTFWLYLVFWGTESDGSSPLDAQLTLLFKLDDGHWAPLAYLAGGAVLFVLSLLMEPNANSLHRLYRDRLSDAFLFLTRRGEELANATGGTAASNRRTRLAAKSSPGDDARPLDRLKLSEIDTDHVPYLLINTALNIQGSPYVNKRGRNADFFVFSRDYIGSHATGFVPTTEMESAHPPLDLGTAMAISGAAASSNMGDQSIRMLAPTLALLNVRLGYWLPNPAMMPGVIQRDSHVPLDRTKAGRFHIPPTFYLLAEMFSMLDETSKKVYLSDGGHVENLGAYELLKRRCRLIVIIDAEADPSYTFSSFILLQRYARIDLGIRVDDLAWPVIRERCRQYDHEVFASNSNGREPSATFGCHAAVGSIDYPDAPPGILLYLKSSITGDENDLIINYKNDNPNFPHETTGDQFFGEAQFEAYRALGFHAMMRLLTGEDRVPSLIISKPDGSPLDGQNDNDARDLRKATIEKIFNDRLTTGTVLKM